MSHFTEAEIDDMTYCAAYAEYIMEHAGGDRVICNGDTLTVAMEAGYLFDDFLESLEAMDRDQARALAEV